MIFVINEKKYDTEKMQIVSVVEKSYMVSSYCLEKCDKKKIFLQNYNCILWRTEKGNWFLSLVRDNGNFVGEAIDENEAKSLLLKHDIEKYEEIFGELEEA